MKSKPRTWHANYSRRIGYAEREGEAIIRRQKAKQRRKDLIVTAIVCGGVFAFFWWAFWMYVTGNTPIW